MVENRSENSISQFEVVVWKYAFNLGTLQPGETKTISIEKYGECHWTVKGTWEGGRGFRREFGYMTPRYSNDDKITIDSTGEFSYNSSIEKS